MDVLLFRDMLYCLCVVVVVGCFVGKMWKGEEILMFNVSMYLNQCD